MRLLHCLLIVIVIGLGFTLSSLYADEVVCTVNQVSIFSDRVHVRCLERYDSGSGGNTIRFFAAPTTDSTLSNQLATLGNQANIRTTTTSSTLLITYDPNDTSGASFGCQSGNCRKISAVELSPVGRRVNLDLGYIEGEKRTALVYPARETTGPYPVVLFFHGTGGTARGAAGNVAIQNKWPSAIIAYGQASNINSAGRPCEKSGWELRFPHKYALGERKDLAYVRLLIDKIKNDYNVDENRIYAVGHSRGGFFTFSLSELMPNTFAAFAAVSSYSRFAVSLVGLDCYPIDSNQAAMPREIVFAKRASDPRPFLYVFGRNDGVFDTDTYSIGRTPGKACSDKSDLVTMPGWSEIGKSWAKHTLDELVYRNYGPYRLVAYHRHSWSFTPGPSDDPKAAEVQFILHPGAHSWPSDASGWVIGFLHRFSR